MGQGSARPAGGVTKGTDFLQGIVREEEERLDQRE